MVRTCRMLVAALAIAATAAGYGHRAFAAGAPDDSLYDSHHPRLLFTTDELPALRSRLSAGGPAADAYAFIRTLATNSYPYWPMPSLVSDGYGMQTIPNLGLAAWVEEPLDSLACERGREVTLYIADHYDVDYDEGNTGLRLRALALGYDLFFRGAPAADRERVYDELVDYVQFITGNPAYELFTIQPYLGNHSAMFAGALGLAAIALQGEADPALLDNALDFADRVCDRLLELQVDPDGAYGEGAFYQLWTMKNLVYYFDARKRFDGTNYADRPRVRAMENALVYELLPEAGGGANNLNDCTYITLPFARMATYFDWATSEWSSGLSAWIWDHVAGVYGSDLQVAADKAGTVLWHRDVPRVAPGSVLPERFLWKDRGLYYYRTGWQQGARSDDVLFSFYSGKFHGGHAQEDQNQFTLYAYGDKYAVDHGAGNVAKESQSHNMVFIDGAGQHNAGFSIGTDGDIAEDFFTGFVDYLLGDATAAYGTHSAFNNPNWPFPGSDWSWGYSGANPVLYAHRRVFVVHGGGEPCVLILDDIDKDGQTHDYEWRLHTRVTNGVDTSANPIVVTGDSSAMDIHVLGPDFGALTITTETYSNQSSEPDSKLLRLSTQAVDPHFSLLLFPYDNTAAEPQVSQSAYAWGYGVTVDRGAGVHDIILRNDDGVEAAYDGVATDARLAVVRRAAGMVSGYFALGMSHLTVGGTLHAECTSGRMGCGRWGSSVDIDRYDAPYRFLDAGLTDIHYRTQALGFTVDGGYAVSDGVTGVAGATVPRAAPRIDVFPNPFNPRTTVRVRAGAGEHVDVVVYDAAGHRVRRLWSGVMDTQARWIDWDGRDDAGARAASGVYLVRAATRTGVATAKAMLLK